MLRDDRLSQSDEIYAFLIPSPEHLRSHSLRDGYGIIIVYNSINKKVVLTSVLKSVLTSLYLNVFFQN